MSIMDTSASAKTIHELSTDGHRGDSGHTLTLVDRTTGTLMPIMDYYLPATKLTDCAQYTYGCAIQMLVAQHNGLHQTIGCLTLSIHDCAIQLLVAQHNGLMFIKGGGDFLCT